MSKGPLFKLANAGLMIILISAACDSVNGASDVKASGAVVDTGQTQCYDNDAPISPPASGAAFYGQDGQYNGVTFNYQSGNSRIR